MNACIYESMRVCIYEHMCVSKNFLVLSILEKPTDDVTAKTAGLFARIF